MNRTLLHDLQNNPHVLAVPIAAISLMVLIINGYGLVFGITNVLPHLFYIPIILTAYFYPRRGILFSGFLSALYCWLTFLIDPAIPGELVSAGGRAAMFIIIAAVVSFLTTRLQESAMQYRGMAERSSDIIILTDTDGRATYVSSSVKKILGFEPAEIVGKPPVDFVHPDDFGRLPASIIAISEERATADITVLFRKKTGGYANIEFFGEPVIRDGSVAGLQLIGRDVTERMRIEEASRETGRRLAEIIDVLPDPTIVIDKDGAVVAWNRAMELLSRIPAREMLGKGSRSYSEWIPGQTGPILIDYVLRRDISGIKTAYPDARFEGNMVRTERNITRANGTRLSLWISATPLIDRDGNITGAIESLRDVTDQKNIQRALRESNAYLDTVINTVGDPLYIKDRNHRFVKLNNSFCQFFGHTREEFRGKTERDFFRKEEADIFWENDEEVFRTRRESENEERFTDPQGNTRTISTKKTLYTNSAGEEFIVGISRDITERKKTELALQQALKKLSMLSSITRHDILNQLTGLRAYLELTKESEKDPELAGFLQKGVVSVDTIRRQIEFSRNYEELGVRMPRWQNVAEIFLSAATQLPLGGITVDERVSGLEVYADPLIEKVFYNFMENSLRHGEHVTAIALAAEETPEGAVITYRDNGAGIDPEDKGKLFRKGFGKNTGLGLFLSREILGITGITIGEDGEPGKGVRFTITVPGGAFRFVD